ncbi:MAG: oxidoreductase, partial [Gemmatimonadaceae bacterium]|nr:oxidoreductase [Gemmatimonadaceae bacterium]
LAQRDVKRVLAYSTVENAGITTLALGLALLGTGLGSSTLAGLAWTAALLHLWNHALAKAPLFLGFGAVAQAARSRRLDALGGLLQRWPVVGGALVLLAAAIAALPGLNVFTSEWLLLRASFAGAVVLRGANAVAVLGAIAAIVLAGAIAVACFTRLVGIALLGTPRTPEAAAAPSPGWAMRAPIALFAAACVAVAAVPGRVASALAAAVKVVAPSADVAPAIDALRPIAVVLPLIMGAVALGLALRGLAARRAPRCSGPTWGCGYPAPTPVMQYSSTSFGEPVTRLLHPLLGTRTHERLAPSGLPGEPRPVAVAWSSETADRVLAGVYEPLFRGMARLAARVRAYHQTRVSAWLLYIVVAVLVLLALLFLPVRWV